MAVAVTKLAALRRALAHPSLSCQSPFLPSV
ncbi:Uncharacterised protein [Bordetella pertussis]|nr:Uncharacterised protein [Bordetella pertussis]